MGRRLFCAAMLVLVAAGAASAAALDNTHMGLRAFAMGKAFTGLADDASAVYYNPGGLAFQPEGFALQGYGLYLMTDLRYTGPNFNPPNSYVSPGAAVENRSEEKTMLPGFFARYRTGNLAFGVGLYVPYGGGKIKYENFSGATAPGVSIEQTLGLTALGGSLAVQLSPNLALGVSVNTYYAIYFLEQKMGTTTLNKDDISGISAISGNLGLFFKASEQLSAGLAIKLPVRIDVEGESVVNVTNAWASRAMLRLPWYFTAGVAFRPTRQLTTTLDVNYALYSQMEDYEIVRGGVSSKTTTHYTDALYVAAGAEFVLNAMLALRGGVTWTPHATDDAGLTLTSDVTHLTFCFGVGLTLTPGIEISLNAHYLAGAKRDTDTSSLTAPITAMTTIPYAQSFDKDVFMLMSGVTAAF